MNVCSLEVVFEETRSVCKEKDGEEGTRAFHFMALLCAVNDSDVYA
jgi:hypothetical protein